MRKKTDESPKPARSDRLRGWWFKGVDQELPPQREELSSAMRTHLDGMASHARDIERAAAGDGVRIRREALSSASSVLGHVEQLESQLALIETEHSKVLGAVRKELAELRDRLGHEAQQAELAAANPRPVLSPAAPVPVNGNGHASGNGHALPVG